MIPYRVKHQLKTWRAARYLKAVDRLPPLRTAAPDTAAAEVHMMLGRYDYHRALAALYTFFHSSQLADRVGLVLHTDPHVSPALAQRLQARLPDARIVPHDPKQPQLAALLDNRPASRHYFATPVGCCQKLFAPAATAEADRIIAIDTDVAFFSPPQAIIDWVDGRDDHPRFILEGPEHGDPGEAVRRNLEPAFELLKPHAPNLLLQSYYFNAGLLCYRASQMNFDLVEALLTWHRGLPAQPPGHWFCDWNIDQTAFMFCYAAWPNAQPFNAMQYRCGGEPAEVCNHFLSPNYYKPACLQRIRDALPHPSAR